MSYFDSFFFFSFLSWSLVLLFYDDIHPNFDVDTQMQVFFLTGSKHLEFSLLHEKGRPILESATIYIAAVFVAGCWANCSLLSKDPTLTVFFKRIFLHHSWWYVKNNVGMYQIQLVVSVSAAGKVVDHHRSDQLIFRPPQLFLPCHIISVTEKQQWILGG